MYRAPDVDLFILYGIIKSQLRVVLRRAACSRETHVSVDCTRFYSTAPCCSAPVAIGDRYKFQRLACVCVALKERRLQHEWADAWRETTTNSETIATV